ncbi:hypothetical protein R1flu_000995 [Riccia fluitans]|uniref:Uncharacterized protein n=1 Tax=Riccia fluitans TaxID=41844 RepID=A0ABD1Y216_9MARC
MIGATQQLAHQVVMYEQSMHILVEVARLENCTGLTYTDLILEVCARIRNNEEQISSFKEEAKKLTGLTKKSFKSLSASVEIQKASVHRISDLLQKQADTVAL